MTADRRAVAIHGAVDDGVAVQSVGDGSAHQDIAQRRNALIQASTVSISVVPVNTAKRGIGGNCAKLSGAG